MSSHVSLQSGITSTVSEKIRVPPQASTPEKEITNEIQDISLSVQPISECAVYLIDPSLYNTLPRSFPN